MTFMVMLQINLMILSLIALFHNQFLLQSNFQLILLSPTFNFQLNVTRNNKLA